MTSAVAVVLCGSFRKDPEGLRAAHAQLLELGCQVLSPAHMEIASERDGFVFLKGQEEMSPDGIEQRHLQAIERAEAVWLHAPDGYVGPSACLEIGYALACGIPVYAASRPTEGVLWKAVQLLPMSALPFLREAQLAPTHLRSLQAYYGRVSLARGYEQDTKECLLGLLDELGELAHGMRKQVRHHPDHERDTGHELADVLLYVVHLANLLGGDLASLTRDKEIISGARFRDYQKSQKP